MLDIKRRGLGEVAAQGPWHPAKGVRGRFIEGDRMCRHLFLIVQFMSSVGWIQSDPIAIQPATWDACHDAGQKLVRSVNAGAFESGGKFFTTARYECREMP